MVTASRCSLKSLVGASEAEMRELSSKSRSSLIQARTSCTSWPESGVGEAKVLLPSEVGVKAKAQGGLGKINAKGLTKEGNGDAYVTLNVDVEDGVGEINLEVV